MEYRELNLHQHILHRPDTYIGSIQSETKDEWIFKNDKIVRENISYIPALERLFIETLSNAIDNSIRSRENNVNCSFIKVSIENRKITILNDGLWIPNEKNSQNEWIPYMIFGKLLTSSNYNDEEERYTSGRNGIGIKAVNIFSKEFSIECADPVNKSVYRQTWRDNMNIVEKPKLTKYSKSSGYTQISWIADFEYFKIENYSEEMIALFHRHLYDTAMITNLSISLNSKKLPIKTFKDYVKLFIQKEYIEFIKPNEYSIAITHKISNSQKYDSISFVNGIHTKEDGVHVDQVLDSLLKVLTKEIQRKLKTTQITAREIRANLSIFISCELPNPTFSSQSKTRLTWPKLSLIPFTAEDIKPMLKWNFVDELSRQLEKKQISALKSSESKRGHVSIIGYDPANKAGTKYSAKCTLILCEGLSAKTFGVAGIQTGVDFGDGLVKGRDWFGVLPLRGKCFSPDTRVKMADKSSKEIRLIEKGEMVVDADGFPTRVLGTISGKDIMYSITLTHSNYIVTQDHVLVLDVRFRPSITWIPEKNKFEVLYFDKHRLKIGIKYVKEFCQAESLINIYNNSEFIKIILTDYLRLDPHIRKLLGGICKINSKIVFDEIISIRRIGFGDYVGIKLGGKHLFQLADGSIVHNCLNVRNAPTSSIAQNKEITNIIQAIGLKYNVDYSNDDEFRKLRYGRIMMLCDADVDAIHIEGLILNIFHYLFPTLLTRKFFFSMKTPIIKIGETRFYDLELARKYILENNPNPTSIRYYKGLGTSTDKDVKDTFGKRIVEYTELNSADDEMELVFHKNRAEDRKAWLIQPDILREKSWSENSNTKFQYTPLSDFLVNDMKKFSMDDCLRNLPSMIDGFKESQRKIIYSAILKRLNQPIKVAQLAGFVAERTSYHHGEQCLFDTIIKLGQDFVGSNNIPLLEKDGQFGTRLSLGKDSASARYIFVKLSKIARKILLAEDDPILKSRVDENVEIEPEYYLPIIPLLLLNGSEGIGTGYSCSIPAYSKTDLCEFIECWLDKTPRKELIPSYSGFTGEIERISKHKFITKGIIEKSGKNIIITEIPIGISIEKIKENLDNLLIQKSIKSFRNLSTPDKVHFEVVGENLNLENLGLISTISTTNIVVLTDESKIRKFKSIEELFENWCEFRLKKYSERKESQLKILNDSYHLNMSRLKFLQLVMSKEIDLYKTENLEQILLEKQLEKRDNSFNYLIDMPIRSFTKTKLNELISSTEKISKNIKSIEKTTPAEMWKSDLNEIK